jgi:hypothetical protein
VIDRYPTVRLPVIRSAEVKKALAQLMQGRRDDANTRTTALFQGKR